MREPNPRVRARERFQLSLDGRQIAAIVAGVLVVLAVVFVLGLNVGKQLATRREEGARTGDLADLDRVPAAPAPARPDPLTFHDRLTKEKPAPPPPPDAPVKPAPSATPIAAPIAAPPPAAARPPVVEAPRPATPEPAPPPASGPASPVPAKPPPASLRPWTVQLAAAEDKGEAERLAAKFPSYHPRIEETVVPGKGRFYRIRVGSFETKDEAKRYLDDMARESGAKGIVARSR